MSPFAKAVRRTVFAVALADSRLVLLLVVAICDLISRQEYKSVFSLGLVGYAAMHVVFSMALFVRTKKHCIRLCLVWLAGSLSLSAYVCYMGIIMKVQGGFIPVENISSVASAFILYISLHIVFAMIVVTFMCMIKQGMY